MVRMCRLLGYIPVFYWESIYRVGTDAIILHSYLVTETIAKEGWTFVPDLNQLVLC